MKALYRKHLLLFLNTAAFLTVGLVLALLYREAGFVFSAVLLGAGLGWIGEHLLQRTGLPDRLQLRGTLVFLLGEALLFVYLGIPILGAWAVVHPVRLPVDLDSGVVGRRAEAVSLTTRDGLILEGWYYPSRNGAAVILVHGLDGNRTHGIHQASILLEEGYGVLMFDMRAHGESAGKRFGGPEAAALDVEAAFRFLVNRQDVPPERIGALGLSAGAGAALYAAADGVPLQAVIAEGVGMAGTADALAPMLPEIRPLFFGIPLNRNYHRFVYLFAGRKPAPPLKEVMAGVDHMPILFIAGGAEWLEPALARRYADRAGEAARLWIAPESTHLRAIYDYPEEYRSRILAFLEPALMGDH